MHNHHLTSNVIIPPPTRRTQTRSPPPKSPTSPASPTSPFGTWKTARQSPATYSRQTPPASSSLQTKLAPSSNYPTSTAKHRKPRYNPKSHPPKRPSPPQTYTGRCKVRSKLRFRARSGGGRLGRCTGQNGGIISLR